MTMRDSSSTSGDEEEDVRPVTLRRMYSSRLICGVGQQSQLLTVLSWFTMLGYGSKYLSLWFLGNLNNDPVG